MATTRNIKLTDLLINTENYRFETVASQKEAIDQMVEDQKDKLYNLAKHIVENGLNPNDKVQVVVSNHDKTKYIVVEGNRRAVALKLLNNPNLIDNPKFAFLKKKFKKLREDNKTKIIKEVECTVYDSPNEADKWIKLKHAGESDGVGTVRWNSLQVQRFEEATEGKSSIALQVINLLQNSNYVPTDIKNNISKLKITNLNRLISDPDVRDFLGIVNNNGVLQAEIEEKEVVKGLSKIARDLLDSKFKVANIYTKEDRKDYISGFSKKDTPDKTNKASKPWQFNGSSPAPAPPKSKSKPNPKERKQLIPKSCSMKISNPKVNSIYHELQKLDLNKFTNAAGVLLRVFVELSVDTYIEKHKLVSTPSAAKSGMNLRQKVLQVANHLQNKKEADEAICMGIKFSVKNNNDLLGLDTWHAYVHNNRFSPTASNLIITWDGIQDFMVILWDNI